jgi:carbamoyltransferase
MLICGLKLTHDGAIALIKDNTLLFSIEMEKLHNNPRFTAIEDTRLIAEVLQANGYDINDVDHFAIDGWGGYDQDALAIQPRLEIGVETNKLSANNGDKPFQMDIAQYREKTMEQDVIQEWNFSGLSIGDKHFNYSSFYHVTGHIMSAYSCSPFAKKKESSYVLVWDGGMYPRLYFVDADKKQVENLGVIFLLIGNIYTIFAQHFGPFKTGGKFAKDSLSIAGKVMAYIALGEVREELFAIFDKVYRKHYQAPMGFANVFANEFKKEIASMDYSDEDILRSFHHYLDQMLVQKLMQKVTRNPRQHRNLCLAGGCALNIKWNSSIRRNGFFDGVFVPPFPNDSGSAIGAACAAMFHKTGNLALNWDAYTGPMIIDNDPGDGWTKEECSIEDLAKLLYETNEPVVFLNDRAEVGPRALGNRSILASPISPEMKGILNLVKKREPYRPISPICLESHAPTIFNPGTPDPHMLFDHFVRPEWRDKIPAVLHLDDTSRLQTVNKSENAIIFKLLTAFHNISGVPLLCNTSANFKGKGFFPDVFSASNWNQVNYVYCNNTLFRKIQRVDFTPVVNNRVSLSI